MVANRSWGS